MGAAVISVWRAACWPEDGVIGVFQSADGWASRPYRCFVPWPGAHGVNVRRHAGKGIVFIGDVNADESL